MPQYNAYGDNYYINVNLSTELELPSGRDTLLHFFEQVKKQYPTMKNFYNREKNEAILEEDKDQGNYRWVSVEQKRVSTGYVNPPTLETVMEQQSFVLDLIPYTLSVSPLDCEALNLMFGFDFNYRGNHNQLIAETLGIVPALERMIEVPGARLIAHDPSITLALDDNCRTQCRVNIEPRTTAYHIRTGEYPEDHLSVFLTIRRYGSLDGQQTYVSVLGELYQIATQLLDNYVVENVLLPLQQAISIK